MFSFSHFRQKVTANQLFPAAKTATQLFPAAKTASPQTPCFLQRKRHHSKTLLPCSENDITTNPLFPAVKTPSPQTPSSLQRKPCKNLCNPRQHDVTNFLHCNFLPERLESRKTGKTCRKTSQNHAFGHGEF